MQIKIVTFIIIFINFKSIKITPRSSKIPAYFQETRIWYSQTFTGIKLQKLETFIKEFGYYFRIP